MKNGFAMLPPPVSFVFFRSATNLIFYFQQNNAAETPAGCHSSPVFVHYGLVPCLYIQPKGAQSPASSMASVLGFGCISALVFISSVDIS
jgi:hypothetical protein